MAGGTDGPPFHTQLLETLKGDASADCLSRSIFKVPNHLRRISEQAYEPQVVSIGPYHHGNGQLKKMEAYKVLYLKKLLERRPEVSLKDYVTALKVKEKEAREFYSEPLNHIGGENFVEMMLLDGCFIIELIRTSASENDHFLTPSILRRVKCDLLLFENQLPFFILSELFEMTVMRNYKAKDFMDIAIKFFFETMPGFPGTPENQDIMHLLGLLHDSYCQFPSSDCQVIPISCSPDKVKRSLCSKAKLKAMAIPCLSSPSKSAEEDKEWRTIRSASELSKAGINFKKIEGRLFDIKFQKGVMSIPTLRIDDDAESILRNLVAYEQCFKYASSKCFSDYIIFMDCLINTGKDVELLSHHGVIENQLGDHEVVATIFNKLAYYVYVSESFSYAEIFIEVEKHCNRKWNLWKANLWRNYFNTPWASISFFAAVFLLLLTVLQSVYSVLSYHFK